MNKKYQELETEDENLLYWFEHNVDIGNRTIYMGSTNVNADGESGVDASMVEYFIKGLHILEMQSPDEKVTILMNNPGGDWYHGMAIYDAIKCSPCPTCIKVYGYAMSMGSIILQAAEERIMMPNSKFMIHYGTEGFSSHPKIVESWMEEGKKNNMTMEDVYLESMMRVDPSILKENLNSLVNRVRSKEVPPGKKVNFKLSKKKIDRKEELRAILRELLNFDTILSADETVELGLADEVFRKR